MTNYLRERHLESARILRKAKSIIEIDGWTTGSMGTRKGERHCVLGAIAHAEGQPLLTEQEVFRESGAAQALGNCIGRPSAGAIYRWNDHVVPNKEFVMDTLERCAQAEERAGSVN